MAVQEYSRTFTPLPPQGKGRSKGEKKEKEEEMGFKEIAVNKMVAERAERDQ